MPSSSGRRLWYVLAGSAAAIVVIIALGAAVGSTGGSGGAGRGQTFDATTFIDDTQLAFFLGLNQLDDYDPNQSDPTAVPLFPSDCQEAASDARKLKADADKLPTVLKLPMSQAVNAFSAAAAACSSGDYTTMRADMSKGHGYLTQADDAFGAHCTRVENSVFNYTC